MPTTGERERKIIPNCSKCEKVLNIPFPVEVSCSFGNDIEIPFSLIIEPKNRGILFLPQSIIVTGFRRHVFPQFWGVQRHQRVGGIK